MDTLQTISRLKNCFDSNIGTFDFTASSLISGADKTELRQQIIFACNGQNIAAKKATFFFTVDILKTYFSQYKLF